jgi:hypothetical protein
MPRRNSEPSFDDSLGKQLDALYFLKRLEKVTAVERLGTLPIASKRKKKPVKLRELALSIFEYAAVNRRPTAGFDDKRKRFVELFEKSGLLETLPTKTDKSILGNTTPKPEIVESLVNIGLRILSHADTVENENSSVSKSEKRRPRKDATRKVLRDAGKHGISLSELSRAASETNSFLLRGTTPHALMESWRSLLNTRIKSVQKS